MLHFNVAKSGEDVLGGNATVSAPFETTAWKVLVLDAAGQRILSPVIKVNDLRDHGITLYLQLHGDRQPIPDVPAVYFVEPTAENIIRICKDLQAGLYESFYLNFTSSIPRALLEDLAYNSVQSGASGLIAKVFDQYLNYVTLEPNLFSLGMPETFLTLNDASSSDTLIDTTLEHVSGALFSTLLALGGQPPLIYAAKGTAAESLGEKIDTRIRNYLVNGKTSFLGASSADVRVEDTLQRPLMLLLDRNFDVSTLLRHTSTYNALVHDILGLHLNRVTINRAGQDAKTYDIDVKDFFWQQNASLPFPTVAENVDISLNSYKEDMQKVTRNNANLQNLDDLNQQHHTGSVMTAEELKVAISVLPEMTERKRIIDSHLQLSTALLEQIKTRDLGNLFHLEQAVGDAGIKSKIVETLRAKDGSVTDKMRLFLVYYFAQEDVGKEDMSMFEVILREAGCDLRALDYCKKVKAYQRMSARAISAPTGNKGTATGDFLQSFGSRISGGVLGNMLSSVKNLLPESADTPLTKLVDSVIEAATGAATGTASALRSTLGGGVTPKDDLFTVFDPKASSRGKAQQMSIQRSAFNHLIVFVVGGSNYTEYNHVVEFVRKKNLRMNVTFGTTELLTGEEFLCQLSKLHRE
jgi:hypothetical protein